MNLKRALFVWLCIAVAETIHGTLRTIFMVPMVGDLPSRQIGVLTGSIIIFIISLIAIRWIGAVTYKSQLQAGALWVMLMMIFEVGLGLAFGFSMERIFADYNLAAGGYMPLGLLFMLFAPALAARVRGIRA